MNVVNSQIIKRGEETGEMEKMLSKTADFYDKQLEAVVSRLTSLIEPMLIVLIATVLANQVRAASLSDIPSARGRPRDFRIRVRELRINAGAGFIVVIAGNIMTMPGLPKVPAAAKIRVLPDGRAVGLS